MLLEMSLKRANLEDIFLELTERVDSVMEFPLDAAELGKERQMRYDGGFKA